MLAEHESLPKSYDDVNIIPNLFEGTVFCTIVNEVDHQFSLKRVFNAKKNIESQKFLIIKTLKMNIGIPKTEPYIQTLASPIESFILNLSLITPPDMLETSPPTTIIAPLIIANYAEY